MISIKVTGSFDKTEKFLKAAKKFTPIDILKRYGEKGVQALSLNTPVDTGELASLWDYEIQGRKGNYTLYFTNNKINNGVPIAIIVQYGHGTRNGGWVQGRDYINPAIRPVFDKLADELWKEVTSI